MVVVLVLVIISGVPFGRCLFPFDTYKIPRRQRVIYTNTAIHNTDTNASSPQARYTTYDKPPAMPRPAPRQASTRRQDDDADEGRRNDKQERDDGQERRRHAGQRDGKQARDDGTRRGRHSHARTKSKHDTRHGTRHGTARAARHATSRPTASKHGTVRRDKNDTAPQQDDKTTRRQRPAYRQARRGEERDDENENENENENGGGNENEERGERERRDKQARARKRNPHQFSPDPLIACSPSSAGPQIIPRPQGVGGAGGKDDSKQGSQAIIQIFQQVINKQC